MFLIMENGKYLVSKRATPTPNGGKVAEKMEASVAYKRREIRAGMLVVALVWLDYHI